MAGTAPAWPLAARNAAAAAGQGPALVWPLQLREDALQLADSRRQRLAIGVDRAPQQRRQGGLFIVGQQG
jgi:hypothetical protein